MIIRLVYGGILLLIVSCSSPSPTVTPDNGTFYPDLASYHLFREPMQLLQPNERVLPYDVITPLFSDYAHKARFVWLPPGTEAQISEPDAPFDFPEGSMLIKNFYYLQGEQRQLIETRLLIRRPDTWEAASYVWNEEQTAARLSLAGDLRTLSVTDDTGNPLQVNYLIPNKNQCKSCHEQHGKLQPIGPRLAYLDHDFTYPQGTFNQLQQWQAVGYLSDDAIRGEVNPIADWQDEQQALEARALAYLEVNCGTCHRRSGQAGISGLYLTTQAEDRDHLGICKSPVSAGKGSGGHRYDIVPGQPEASILLYRMLTDDPGAMMPELGRSVIHQEGVELVRDWIASLAGDCPDGL